MTIDFDDLVRNGVHVAGAINEVFLNKFSASHHKTVPSVYEGQQRFSHFENDVQIRYKVRSPIQFDFSPQIPAARFKRLWLNHLKHKGARQDLTLSQVITTPPNLQLTADDVLFQVVVFEGHTNNELLSIDFEWDLKAQAAVALKGDAVVLEPLRVAFSTGAPAIESQIARRIASLSKATQPRHPVTLGDPTDPVWCAKVEQLILLLVNQVLATQISNFIRSWELPRAIKVADGIALSPTYLQIHGDDLVVGGQITTQPTGQSPLQAQLDQLMQGFSSRAEAEFSALTEKELEVWHPDRSPTIDWLHRMTQSYESIALQELKMLAGAPAKRYAPNMQLLFRDEPFDALAKRYLSINNGESFSVELDRLLKAEAGWWFRVSNARAGIAPGGVEVHADVVVGGRAQVCHFDIDPKNFGSWRCYGPHVELYPQPDFGIQALPTFPSSGVYLSARLLTTGIGVRLPDWPGWANRVLGWVTGNLTRPLLSALAAIIALFRVRVVGYPHHFPGTGLEWKPNINTTPTNHGPYLVISADPEFE